MSNFDASHPEVTTRIVTLRLYEGDKANAEKVLKSLLDYLKQHAKEQDYTVGSHVEEELSVYDSNVSHDLGWIMMAD